MLQVEIECGEHYRAMIADFFVPPMNDSNVAEL